jgi:hypothetical protein
VRPSWKYRRFLIFATFLLGVGMIVWGGIQFASNAQVLDQLVIGGCSLISIILTAYIGFASYEDVKISQGESGGDV